MGALWGGVSPFISVASIRPWPLVPEKPKEDTSGHRSGSGWWLSHSSEKYEFVNLDDDIPQLNGKIKHVPKHRPGSFGHLSLIFCLICFRLASTQKNAIIGIMLFIFLTSGQSLAKIHTLPHWFQGKHMQETQDTMIFPVLPELKGLQLASTR